ncbi:MAG: efflux RND transporter periplasmic adaptor subunit [Rhodanobacter sp.]
MDIARKPLKKPVLRRYWPLFAAGGVVMALFLIYRSIGGASYVAQRRNLVFSEVRRGEFVIQIRGVGMLVPKNIRWLAANVDGRVESLPVEAGAKVKKGDVIANLVNPKLKEQLEESSWELVAADKEQKAKIMEAEASLASIVAEESDAEMEYKSAMLKVQAEGPLAEKGIVPRLEYEQAKLTAEQFKERTRMQRDRVQRMEANVAAMREAYAARMSKMHNTHNLIQQQIDDLTIRSRIDGVVQSMSLKLGQQVTPGTEAAKVAPYDNLVAMLDVQDFLVRDIAPGQSVTIDTRSSKVPGKVVRIDPAVVNGVVKVEVALDGQMPPEARPDLSVEGVIDVERKPDTLFVDRPALAQSGSRTSMYLLNEDGDAAKRVIVQFGRASTRQIEVVAGLKPGDRVIVSDASAWESHRNILIR